VYNQFSSIVNILSCWHKSALPVADVGTYFPEPGFAVFKSERRGSKKCT
jgi:hypothetical protein